MSRSYKKTPSGGDKNDKDLKRYANKRVRQQLKNEETAYSKRGYKKEFEPWEIKDYYSIAPTFEVFYHDMVTSWELHGIKAYRHQKQDEPPSKAECRKLYDKWFMRK